MSTYAPVAEAQHDEGCRIVTISASLAGSHAFISRVKALASDPSPTDDASLVIQSETGPHISRYIISNRYYTADVHFAAYALHAVYPSLFSLDRGPDYKPPPAVIFVWVDGEPYAKHIDMLSRVMATASYEPEVCLAVRIPKATAADGLHSADEAQDDNVDIDSTLMSYGFEYVDGTRESIPLTETDSESTDNDIPRLPRVLDALSTIMWPSMQSSRSTNETRPPSEISSTSMARREWERDSIMEELLSVSGISGISRSDTRHTPLATAGGPDTDDEEIDVLFSPYDFNSNAHFGGASPAVSQRPWVDAPMRGSGAGAESKGGTLLATSPTEMVSASPFGLHAAASPFGLHAAAFGHPGAGAREVSIGFEDDFTVFVSAPADPEKGAGAAKTWAALDLTHAGFGVSAEGEATPVATAFPDSLGGRSATGLTPASAHSARGRGRGGGMLYRSLGSVSDFGGDDAERSAYQALDDAPPPTDEEEEDYGAEEWEDGVEEERDESWEEHTGDWDDGGEGEGDEDMPTRDEILATAARIFGGVPAGGGGFRTAAEVNREAQAKAQVSDAATSGSAAPGALAPENVHQGGADDDELGPAGPIDIEHVLRSLQGLRTEIAGVEDEEERRRMAARVALGFVYGMDLEKGAPGSVGDRVQ